MNLLHLFQSFGRWTLVVLRFARANGLDDELLDLALRLVTHAQPNFQTNDERRDYVLGRLKAAGIPESIARLAIELAVQAYKKKV